MNRFRGPALVALWVNVALTFGLCAFVLWNNDFDVVGWIDAFRFFLAGLVLTWWTQLFALVSQRRGVNTENGLWRSLALSYPWLTVFSLTMWTLVLLGLLSDGAPEANPVALTALMTVWGGAILATNAVNAGLLRLASGPDAALGQNAARLLDWLNLGAALSLGMLVINLVPIKGFSSEQTMLEQVVYAASGLADTVSTLLAFFALRAAHPEGKS